MSRNKQKWRMQIVNNTVGMKMQLTRFNEALFLMIESHTYYQILSLIEFDDTFG
jgi:hypothetical protein